MEKLIEFVQALEGSSAALLVALVSISALAVVGLSLYIVLELVRSRSEGGEK